MDPRVFVSYSRADESLASSVVQLLRAREDVFFDVDSIRPGLRWRDAIREAIESAGLIYVLWCGHAATSVEVLGELEQAVQADKPVVPVLLDSTPLVEYLRVYQWVDLGEVVVHEAPPPPAGARGPAEPGRSCLVPAAIAVVALLLTLAAVAVSMIGNAPSGASGPGVLWGVLGVAAVLWGVRWSRSRRARPPHRSTAAESEAIAESIALDLRRRR